MRHHFHRCRYLRVIEIDARDRSRARKGGSQVVDELCEARKLAPCRGLAECDVLSAAQKRDLLVTRATRLREEEGGRSPLVDARDSRAEALLALREELLEERGVIVEENRRRHVEAAGAVQRNPRPLRPSEEAELATAGVSVLFDDELRELQTGRLDAIDRALDAIAHGARFVCARCTGPIEVERLRAAPDTAVCARCAEALPVEPGARRRSRRPAAPGVL